MSIAAQIARLKGKGTLSELEPPMRRSARRVLLSAEVRSMLDAAFEDSDEAALYAESRAVIEGFVRDKRISFGWDPYEKDAASELARVDADNVYMFDFRSPGDDGGIRVLGCFAEKDCFVALTWAFRGSMNWDGEIARAKATWKCFFGVPPPRLGGNRNDYLSGNYQAS